MSSEPAPLSVQAIAYYSPEVTHPLRRAVRFLSVFGIVVGTHGIILNVMGLARPLVTRLSLPEALWLGIMLTQSVLSLFLIGCSVASLRARPIGRKGLILYAYAALVLMGTSFGVSVFWSMETAGSWNSAMTRLRYLLPPFWSALNSLMFPVLVLVIFRDGAVAEYFNRAALDGRASSSQHR